MQIRSNNSFGLKGLRTKAGKRTCLPTEEKKLALCFCSGMEIQERWGQQWLLVEVQGALVLEKSALELEVLEKSLEPVHITNGKQICQPELTAQQSQTLPTAQKRGKKSSSTLKWPSLSHDQQHCRQLESASDLKIPKGTAGGWHGSLTMGRAGNECALAAGRMAVLINSLLCISHLVLMADEEPHHTEGPSLVAQGAS